MVLTHFYKSTLGIVLALGVSTGAASAVTIGSLTFDQTAFADNATIDNTIGGTRGPAVGAAGAADGDFTTAANLNDSFVEIFFTDNILFNGPGADLVIFESTNNNVIRLSTGPDTNSPTTTSVVPNFIPASDPGNTSGFSLNAAAIDLSTLGIADGAEFTSGLYLSRGGVFTTVWDVAALNSRPVGTSGPGTGPMSPIPLPAGLPLLLAGLGAIGLLRGRAR